MWSRERQTGSGSSSSPDNPTAKYFIATRIPCHLPRYTRPDAPRPISSPFSSSASLLLASLRQREVYHIQHLHLKLWLEHQAQNCRLRPHNSSVALLSRASAPSEGEETVLPGFCHEPALFFNKERIIELAAKTRLHWAAHLLIFSHFSSRWSHRRGPLLTRTKPALSWWRQNQCRGSGCI